MIQGQGLVTVLVLMTSCLSLSITADTQSTDAASSKNDASLAKSSTQQQNLLQQRQQLQMSSPQAQSNFNSPNIPPSHSLGNTKYDDNFHFMASLSDKDHSISNVHGNREYSYRDPGIMPSSFRSLVKNQYEVIGRQNSDIGDSEGQDSYISSPSEAQSDSLPGEDHSISKRAAATFDGQRVYYYKSPFVFDQLGKRLSEMSLEDFGLVADKRPAPRFVGRRGAPYFVGKRNDPMLVGKLGFEFEDQQLQDDKRGAPRFVGKRRAPMFIGKRRAPAFVGKRKTDFDDENPLLQDDKRAAPKFVGRLGSPFVAGKRRAPMFIGKRLPVFEFGDQELEDDKRGAPRFVGKRRAPMFIGKRRAPAFVGKRMTDFDDETPLLQEDKRRAPTFVGRRGAGKDAVLGELNSFDEEKRSGNNFFLDQGVTDRDTAQLLEALSRLEAIKEIKKRIQNDKRVWAPGMVGRRSDEEFQTDASVEDRDEAIQV